MVQPYPSTGLYEARMKHYHAQYSCKQRERISPMYGSHGVVNGVLRLNERDDTTQAQSSSSSSSSRASSVKTAETLEMKSKRSYINGVHARSAC